MEKKNICLNRLQKADDILSDLKSIAARVAAAVAALYFKISKFKKEKIVFFLLVSNQDICVKISIFVWMEYVWLKKIKIFAITSDNLTTFLLTEFNIKLLPIR